jgi:hypothetical protein
MPHAGKNVPAQAGGALAGAWQQNPALTLNTVKVHIYEKERGDTRFELVEVGEGEVFMKICDSWDEDRNCIEVGLTVAEAIALALRLIRYAAEAYQKEIAKE